MPAKVSLRLLSGSALICLLLASGPAFAFGEKASSSSDGSSSETQASSLGDSQATSSGETVWITRPDGAEQCAPKSGQSLGGSAGELKKAGVHILNSQKGDDGKMHAQMCGIPSGKTNMFQIPKDDLGKAIALGFHAVK